jgi:hypothetical protein
VSFSPLGLGTSGKGEWDQEQGDRSNEEDSTDNVELPEKVGDDPPSELLEGSSVAGQSTSSSGSSASDQEDSEDENGRNCKVSKDIYIQCHFEEIGTYQG